MALHQTTRDLRSVPERHGAAAELERLRAVNKDLLAALKFVRDAVGQPALTHSMGELAAKWRAFREQADAAIARATAAPPCP